MDDNLFALSGDKFIRALPHYLSEQTGMAYVFIGEIERPAFKKVNATSFWAGGDYYEGYSYDLAQTPCENVFGQGVCVYERNVQNLFPDDEDLKKFGIEGYVGTSLFSANGDAIGLLVALHDKPIENSDRVSSILNQYCERVAAELDHKYYSEAILTSESRFSGLYNQSAAAVALFDINGRLFRANPAFTELLDCMENEILNFHFSKLFGSKNDNKLDQIWTSLIEGKTRGQRFDLNFETKKKNDNKWVDISLSRTEDSSGTLTHLNCVMIDVTEQKRASLELAAHKDRLELLVAERTKELKEATEVAKKANLAKSEFLSAMSHDLRTPLNSILGFSQLIENDPHDKVSAKHLRFIQQIHQSGDHLLQLINQVLDLAKIEAGKVTYNFEPINASEVMQECLMILSPLAENKNISVYNLSAKHGTNVKADPTRLKQILINLISNAIKYNKQNGTVAIEMIKSNDHMLEFSITDSGVGIDDSEKPLVFEVFQRIHAEDSEIEGSGIGLNITQNLVVDMGGEIGFTSQKGKGSRFWFTLPIVP